MFLCDIEELQEEVARQAECLRLRDLSAELRMEKLNKSAAGTDSIDTAFKDANPIRSAPSLPNYSADAPSAKLRNLTEVLEELKALRARVEGSLLPEAKSQWEADWPALKQAMRDSKQWKSGLRLKQRNSQSETTLVSELQTQSRNYRGRQLREVKELCGGSWRRCMFHLYKLRQHFLRPSMVLAFERQDRRNKLLPPSLLMVVGGCPMVNSCWAGSDQSMDHRDLLLLFKTRAENMRREKEHPEDRDAEFQKMMAGEDGSQILSSQTSQSSQSGQSSQKGSGLRRRQRNLSVPDPQPSPALSVPPGKGARGQSAAAGSMPLPSAPIFASTGEFSDADVFLRRAEFSSAVVSAEGREEPEENSLTIQSVGDQKDEDGLFKKYGGHDPLYPLRIRNVGFTEPVPGKLVREFIDLDTFAAQLWGQEPTHAGRGLHALRSKLGVDAVLKHVVYSLMRGRLVVILALPENQSRVIDLVHTLKIFLPGYYRRPMIVPWRASGDLFMADLPWVKLMGLAKIKRSPSKVRLLLVHDLPWLLLMYFSTVTASSILLWLLLLYNSTVTASSV